MAFDPITNPPPRRVDRYRVLRLLGKGGMAKVYSAYDPELDRKVALKLIHLKPEGEDQRAKKRL